MRPKAIPGSISMCVLIMRIVTPEANRALGLSCFILSNVDGLAGDPMVKYHYKEHPKTAPILEGDQNGPPIATPIGGKTLFVSIWNQSANFQEGDICRLDGVYYELYQKVSGGPIRTSFMASCCTPMANPARRALIEGVPFTQRCIDLVRDLPGENRLAYYDENSTDLADFNVFTVRLGDGNAQDGPNAICGVFDPVDPDKAALDYIPYTPQGATALPAIMAITGGRIDVAGQVKVQDAQFKIQQTQEGKEPIVVLGLTKVYHNSGLDLLDMDWMRMGNHVVPYIHGEAYCTVNRRKTARLEMERNDKFQGTFYIDMIIQPDMAQTARAMGYKVSWPGCVQLEPRLANPTKMEFTGGETPDRMKEATAINILRYTGNIEYLVQAAERGWVEFFVITNMPVDETDGEARRQELQAMDEPALIKELTDKRLYIANKGRYTCIFAVPTASCPGRITEFVAANGTPIGKRYLAPPEPAAAPATDKSTGPPAAEAAQPQKKTKLQKD